MQFSYNWNAKETSAYSNTSCMVGAVIFSNNVDPTTFTNPRTVPEYASPLRVNFSYINGAILRSGGLHTFSNAKENYTTGDSTGVNVVTGFKYVITFMYVATKKHYSLAGVEVTHSYATAIENIQARILTEFGINLDTNELGDNDYFIKNMIVEVY